MYFLQGINCARRSLATIFAVHLCVQDGERIYGWPRVRKYMGLLQSEF